MRGERAAELFCAGYNCAQAVVLAFADDLEETGIDEKTLAKLASSFGGGMGRLREVCGAVSGMFMVYGLMHGYDSPTPSSDDPLVMEIYRQKNAQYHIVQEMAEEFHRLHGSIVCRKILKKPSGPDLPQADERTTSYYQSRPCIQCVKDAADILEKILKN